MSHASDWDIQVALEQCWWSPSGTPLPKPARRHLPIPVKGDYLIRTVSHQGFRHTVLSAELLATIGYASLKSYLWRPTDVSCEPSDSTPEG